jgi:hypothetical protein
MPRLPEFYQGNAAGNRGRTLAVLWGYSDGQLAAIHASRNDTAAGNMTTGMRG